MTIIYYNIMLVACCRNLVFVVLWSLPFKYIFVFKSKCLLIHQKICPLIGGVYKRQVPVYMSSLATHNITNTTILCTNTTSYQIESLDFYSLNLHDLVIPGLACLCKGIVVKYTINYKIKGWKMCNMVLWCIQCYFPNHTSLLFWYLLS